MIAVWLVAPPFSVTSASTTPGSRPGGVGRREVTGDEHRWRVGQRDARLRLAHQPRDEAAFDVQQVGGALGHQAAHRGEQVDELGDRPVHGVQQVLAALDPGRHCLPQPLVAGQPGAGGQHLGRRAAGPGRLVARTPSATAPAALSNAASAASGSARPPYAATAARRDTSCATSTTGP